MIYKSLPIHPGRIRYIDQAIEIGDTAKYGTVVFGMMGLTWRL